MKILLILILSTSYLFSNNNSNMIVTNIDKTLQKVIRETKNRSIKNIKITYDPFNPKQMKKNKNLEKTVNKKTKKTYKKPIVSMIFDKKAFIDGKWYKENSKFADYVITKINQNIVILRKKNKYLTLKLPSAKNILITKEEIK